MTVRHRIQTVARPVHRGGGHREYDSKAVRPERWLFDRHGRSLNNLVRDHDDRAQLRGGDRQ
jgi:hypothetical protein